MFKHRNTSPSFCVFHSKKKDNLKKKKQQDTPSFCGFLFTYSNLKQSNWYNFVFLDTQRESDGEYVMCVCIQRYKLHHVLI